MGPEGVRVHRINQRSDMLGWRELRDTVAEVEHVAGAAPERVEDAARLALDGLGRAEKRHRVEVALQGDAIADAIPRVSQVGLPVDAERVGAGLRHRLEPEA